jgi:hypothetical protein
MDFVLWKMIRRYDIIARGESPGESIFLIKAHTHTLFRYSKRKKATGDDGNGMCGYITFYTFFTPLYRD